MKDIQSFLHSMTSQPGVYQMLGSQANILYVGKARNLKKRLTSYFSKSQKDIKTIALLKHVTDIQVTVTRTENEALLLECNLIKKHKPHYNVLFRDDKSYPYILITENHAIPRIEFYRGNKKREGMYFGPYPNSLAVRQTINLIEKLFHLRTCSDSFYANRQRPCLQYQIGRCSGPCVGHISEEEYRENVHHAILFLRGKNQQIVDELSIKMEAAADKLQFELAAKYRDQIARIRQIQDPQYADSGESDLDVMGFAFIAGMVCVQLLMIRHGMILGSRAYFPSVPDDCSAEEILTSFITQHYLNNSQEIPKEILLDVTLPDLELLKNVLSEQAQHKVVITQHVRGDRRKWLEMANANAKQSVNHRLVQKANVKQRFEALQAALALDHLPKRIECFDISHTMGEETVASCVVFDRNGPVKSDYRRFNINDITPGNDIAAMEQALSRRYKKLEDAILPDVLLMDGGRAQLNVAEKLLGEFNIFLVGVAKGVTRKPGFETLYLPGHRVIELPPDSNALHLIQQIRDEAHRFAITGHRQRRDKKRRTSTLEQIPGIGAKRRRELLRYFGGIQAINRASLDELEKVPGMSRTLAERVFAALHMA